MGELHAPAKNECDSGWRHVVDYKVERSDSSGAVLYVYSDASLGDGQHCPATSKEIELFCVGGSGLVVFCILSALIHLFPVLLLVLPGGY